jgi:hypothetical protein
VARPPSAGGGAFAKLGATDDTDNNRRVLAVLTYLNTS